MKQLKVKIRKAKKEDISAVVRLNMKLTDYIKKLDIYGAESSKVEKCFRKYIRDIIKKRNVIILVAEVNGKIVGTMRGAIQRASPVVSYNKVGRVSGVFVEEDYRRLGLGKKMFEELKKWFTKKKIRILDVMVNSDSKAAISAYEKFGFREYSKNMRLNLGKDK
jgi:ribosomal protein S18 acetylase RimI-like enzyme